MSFIAISMVFVCLLFSSCATMIHGKDQKVSVKTEPAGAQVYVNGQEAGEAPIVLTLPRKQDHEVHAVLSGYHAEAATLKRSLAGTSFLYLLPGGLISLGIDSVNGAQYKLPESVNLTLKPLFDPDTIIAAHMGSFKAMNKRLLTEFGSTQYQKLA